MKLDLTPTKSIGPIELGMTRDEVRSVMEHAGYPFCYEKKTMDYFFENSIQTEYEDGTVSFIGIACDQRIELIYKGKDLFDLSAKEVFELIADSEKENHQYNENEYLFPDQITTLWEADSQYDKKRNEERVAWAQIGIGDERHLTYSTT